MGPHTKKSTLQRVKFLKSAKSINGRPNTTTSQFDKRGNGFLVFPEGLMCHGWHMIQTNCQKCNDAAIRHRYKHTAKVAKRSFLHFYKA